MDKLQQRLLPIKLEAREERLTNLAARGWLACEAGYRASAQVKPLVWRLQAGGGGWRTRGN